MFYCLSYSHLMCVKCQRFSFFRFICNCRFYRKTLSSHSNHCIAKCVSAFLSTHQILYFSGSPFKKINVVHLLMFLFFFNVSSRVSQKIKVMNEITKCKHKFYYLWPAFFKKINVDNLLLVSVWKKYNVLVTDSKAFLKHFFLPWAVMGKLMEQWQDP